MIQCPPSLILHLPNALIGLHSVEASPHPGPLPLTHLFAVSSYKYHQASTTCLGHRDGSSRTPATGRVLAAWMRQGVAEVGKKVVDAFNMVIAGMNPPKNTFGVLLFD